MKKNLKKVWPIYLVFLVVAIVIGKAMLTNNNKPSNKIITQKPSPGYWVAPVLNSDNNLTEEQRKMVSYGRQLIANTSKYFGPHGSINAISNGMNCQNCHLDAGTRPWANNYGAVASTYPKFRERSGTIEDIPKRVNDCFERSLNGKAIDTTGYEMKSIIAYMQWLGKDVKKGVKPKGTGITDLIYLERAASPSKGQIVYNQKCQSCHGGKGEGLKNVSDTGFVFPPLWGEHSYNNGAGLYRISRFAGYVKDNMPFNQASHQATVLTDEEAWDVAAFVNSQPRPKANLKNDWPNISGKPIDYPFGPFADDFTEEQHKYGPFKPIAAKRAEMKKIEQKSK
ncbi:c-type cytochrome [Segetibacter koreensis]|uniref:c-type cytochrome n=1 Tax=Segetibacter koreensis TaxID=398037 RepID=UPI00038147EE|nr:c-type cytochrome [Segetibacter koreensis]